MARQFLLAGLFSVLACTAAAQAGYVGFDRNVYPGDAALPALRQAFRYAGYWLNAPPGASRNSWTGKRAVLKQNGLGFLVLFNGRLEAALKGSNPSALGRADGRAAAAAAKREGFAGDVRIFLDQEEGGRLTAGQLAYLFAWIDAVRAAGARAGVYCSGIDVPDGGGTINTAQQIAQLETARAPRNPKGKAERLALWIADDQCPPSPGCSGKAPSLDGRFPETGAVWTPVWQYAQSPRRMEFTAACGQSYAPDGNCYAPGLPAGPNTFLDLNVAESADPSEEP